MIVGNVEQHAQKLSHNNSQQSLRGVLHVPQNTKLTIAKQRNGALSLATANKCLDAADRQLPSVHFHCYCYCYYSIIIIIVIVAPFDTFKSSIKAPSTVHSYALDKIVNLTSLSS